MNTQHPVIQKAKLAVIAGAASGIGLAVAGKLVQTGIHLIFYGERLGGAGAGDIGRTRPFVEACCGVRRAAACPV